ncbi:MAG TPA: shikimate dehydrogenase [Bacillota bacterium]
MTYQLGLIGFPIQHSLSPWIHHEFLERAGLTGSYDLLEIHPTESFSRRVAELKQSGIHGFNVTVPYKQTIIPYLDELDEQAEKIGAVNTVFHHNGKWIGFNTDGVGYVRSLEYAFPHLFQSNQKERFLIIGAGGAARGIYVALVLAGIPEIDLANRTVEKAEDIAKRKPEETSTSIMTIDEAAQRLDDYGVIIQTTSVGMKPHEDEMIMSVDQLKEGSIVSDIVYQPIMTKFLKEAKKRGASIHFGHTMLLHQAQYAFEIWTGERVSTKEMDERLRRILEGE